MNLLTAHLAERPPWGVEVDVARGTSGQGMRVRTDGPGFAVDEDPSRLGESLVLPPWLEPHRSSIQTMLPRLEYPPKLADAAAR